MIIKNVAMSVENRIKLYVIIIVRTNIIFMAVERSEYVDLYTIIRFFSWFSNIKLGYFDYG